MQALPLPLLAKPQAINLILRVYHNPGIHAFADFSSTNSQGDFILLDSVFSVERTNEKQCTISCLQSIR